MDRETSKKVVYSMFTEWTNDYGNPHREDGPAIEWANGGKEWYINGIRHRMDGPAFIHPFYGGISHWFMNGNDVTNEITEWANEMGMDLDNLTDNDRTIIFMIWNDNEAN